MKPTFFSIVLGFLLVLFCPSLPAQTSIALPLPLSKLASADDAMLIEWNQKLIDLGEINAGEELKFNYSFTNRGDGAVKIARVKPGCGCTTVAYSREEIAPGEKGQITAAYKAKHEGFFTKTVSVYFEREAQPVVLRLKGFVSAQEKTEN